VYDVTGAGDTVTGALGVALAAGVPLPDGCHLAATAAAVVVGKLGTAAIDAGELTSGPDVPASDAAAGVRTIPGRSTEPGRSEPALDAACGSK
jgi:D-beta-D-heptose 7-phosphate kinase/D-beta-D-heptose 1-phosphate adenosyltransferase